MDKNKALLIIAPVLFIAAIYFSVPALMIGRSALLASVNRAGAGFQPFPYKNELLQLLGEESGKQKKPVDLPRGERNPFDISPLKPPEKPVAAAPAEDKGPNVVLMGILMSGARPSAIINDAVVGVGTKIEGLTVKEISEGYVVLTNGVKETTLKLKQ
jgi:hypothetical protein